MLEQREDVGGVGEPALVIVLIGVALLVVWAFKAYKP
jgi:hypothetical protein